MERLHIAKKNELHQVAEFITNGFWGLEHYKFLAEGLSKPKELLLKMNKASLYLFFNKGDVYIYGDDKIKGVFVGIPTKKYTLFNILLSSLKTLEVYKDISRQDVDVIKEKNKIQEKIHDLKWYKKYSKNSYYLFQVVVAKEYKGTGVFRKLISPILEECEKKNMDIVLETNTKSNIPIYEHFGFELVETKTSNETTLEEYCMIKRNNKKLH